jgi:hypothetical protein
MDADRQNQSQVAGRAMPGQPDGSLAAENLLSAPSRRRDGMRARLVRTTVIVCFVWAAGFSVLLTSRLRADTVVGQSAPRGPLPPVMVCGLPQALPIAPIAPPPTELVVPVSLKQPDAPRAPVVQPIPLPPPTESIPPGGSAMQAVPAPNYGNTAIKPIGALTINILPSAGQVPKETDPIRTLEQEFGSTEFRREPIDYVYHWESPAFFNRPLYFEQPNLERYGYTWGPLGQPFVSAAQFFVKIPLLPYMMTVHCPNEPIYSLGYYRPGSRAPYQINWPDVRLDATIVETAFITGLIFLIP